MQQTATSTNSRVIDHPASIAAAVALAVIGVAFYMAMPVMVGAWSEHAGFTAREAGLLASIDSGGGIFASLLIAKTLNRWHWHMLARAGITIAIAANVASIYADSFVQLLISRAVAGFGSGVMYALGLAALATSENTGRNFSILVFVQVSFGMLEINIFPYLAQRSGMSGIYLGMIFAFVGSLLLVHLLPSRGRENTDAVSRPSSIATEGGKSLPWLCLAAVFLFYLAVGSFWAYVELIGHAGELEPGLISASLTYTQMLSLLGCVIAGWVCARIGQSRPLLFSLACIAAAIYSLTLGITAFSYVGVLCVFFLFWNAIDIYQLGTLGNLDQSGRFAAMVPAFQIAAAALGPAIAAWLLNEEGDYGPILMMASGCILCAALAYLAVYLQLSALPGAGTGNAASHPRTPF